MQTLDSSAMLSCPGAFTATSYEMNTTETIDNTGPVANLMPEANDLLRVAKTLIPFTPSRMQNGVHFKSGTEHKAFALLSERL